MRDIATALQRPTPVLNVLGWPRAMRATLRVNEDQAPTCYHSEEHPTLIDFAMISEGAQSYLDSIQLVVDSPWRPHLMQEIRLKGRQKDVMVRQLVMPKNFTHPPRLQKALEILDTDKSGELDVDECTARCRIHPRASRRVCSARG